MQKKLLLVDDEDENLELLKAFLKDEYTLFSSKNGPSALTFAMHQKPDLILLDIMMPGMDGYEVCRRLKADEQTKDIPVIFITTKRKIEDEIDGLKIGAADYIAKPLILSVVKERVKTHLALQSASKFKQDVERVTRHDLKSPINSTLEYADVMLQDRTLSTDQRKYLTIIRNYGFNALHMINLSLGLFQMERGTYTLNPSNLDLLPVIMNVRAKFRSLIQNKKLTLEIGVQGRVVASKKDSFFVRGEKMLCYSILTNLLKNALEASPNGQTVTISLNHSGDMGIVRIHNLGVVPQKIQDRFFEKHASSEKKPGRGLGIYFAKLIAEIHGGKIRMKTDETKGTEIAFLIPKGEFNPRTNRKAPVKTQGNRVSEQKKLKSDLS